MVLSKVEGMVPLLEKLSRTVPQCLWHSEPGGVIRCVACAHRCKIAEGKDGICKVRGRRNNQLVVPWGYVAGIQADPIEKKPFFHAYPGSVAFSFGMLGCDIHCSYCQNWVTSQVGRDENADGAPVPTSVSELMTLSKGAGAKVLVSTYNEPLITSEWAVEIFKSGKAAGFQTAYVSNGNATPEVLEYIRPYVDLYKIDLKSFQEKHYRELGCKLESVIDSIRRVYEMGFWLEVVTLLIPGFNDGDEEIRSLTEFLASVSPEIPWHATAYHPDYQMLDRGKTPLENLYRAKEWAEKAGLKYVYLGNAPGRVAEWEDTRCSKCHATLIERKGFRVLSNRIKDSKCPDCSNVIPGRWE